MSFIWENLKVLKKEIFKSSQKFKSKIKEAACIFRFYGIYIIWENKMKNYVSFPFLYVKKQENYYSEWDIWNVPLLSLQFLI